MAPRVLEALRDPTTGRSPMVRKEYFRKAREARGPAYTVEELRRMRERRCDGCGERFAGREMVEVMEDHGSLTFFEGDEVCRECAADHGVV